MRRVRRVAFFGETGIGNYGNDASLAAGLALLDGTGARPLAVAQLPAVVAAEHGVEAVEIRRPSAPRHGWRSLWGRVADVLHLHRTVRSVDAVVVPGTGIFEAPGVRPRGIPFSLFWLALWAWLGARPLMLLSVGVEEGGVWGVRWFFSCVLAWADYVSVRDEGSAAAVAALGVARPVPVVPDVVLRRDPHARPGPGVPVESGDGAVVAVGVMDWGGAERDADREVYTARSVDLVRALLADGVRVRVVTGEELDLRVAHEVVRRVHEAAPAAEVVVSGGRSVEDVAHAVAGCHVVVAARYHNLVAAVSEGVPVVATGYSRKQASLVAHYGLPGKGPGRTHHRDTYDVATVVAQVREILADHDVESAHVRAVADADRAAVRAQEHRVRELLGISVREPVAP